MGFTPPVPQKYTDWEIRAAVLLSLFIQICLIFVAPWRRRSASRGPRFLVWCFYLLADWIADLALGLLLNNMGNIGSSNSNASLSVSTIGSRASGGKHPAPATDSSSSPIIFAFWAPFLLLHLGGPDTITAYSIEDAELWPRHLIGLLFELFAASVVFFCSLSGNPLIPASVLMFVVGIVKYAERTYSLYRGSVDGFRDSVLGEPDPGPNYAKLMEEYKAKKDANLPADIEIHVDEVKRLEPVKIGSLQYIAHQFYLEFRRLFVDLILSFDEREISRAYFCPKDTDSDKALNTASEKAFTVVEMELSYIYDVTYTKAAVIHTGIGYGARLLGSACIITAFLFFAALNKQNFQKVDIAITYTLLIGAISLDGVALLMLLFSDWTQVSLEQSKMGQHFSTWQMCKEKMGQMTCRCMKRRWGEKMSQLNLISYCLDKPVKPADKNIIHHIFYHVFQRKPLFHFFKKISEKLCCTEMLNQTIYVTHEAVTRERKQFIFEKLKEKSEKVTNPEAIKMVCNERGMAAFEKIISPELLAQKIIRKEVADSNQDRESQEKQEYCLSIIRESLDPKSHEFDHSLLLWHIATELCYKKCNATSPGSNEAAGSTTDMEKCKSMGKLLSDYMLYLLVMQPAMLMTTAGIGLIRFRDTCAEASRFFKQGGWELDQEKACKMLMSVDTSTNPTDVKGDRSKSVLFDACILAKCLLELKDKELMWRLIAEVWAEMLFYTASHCRGYGHVRQLSKGGEMLTIVWLLMAHVGLGEMYQIQGGYANAKLIAEK